MIVRMNALAGQVFACVGFVMGIGLEDEVGRMQNKDAGGFYLRRGRRSELQVFPSPLRGLSLRVGIMVQATHTVSSLKRSPPWKILPKFGFRKAAGVKDPGLLIAFSDLQPLFIDGRIDNES